MGTPSFFFTEITSCSTYLSPFGIWGAKHIQFFLCLQGPFPIKDRTTPSVNLYIEIKAILKKFYIMNEMRKGCVNAILF